MAQPPANEGQDHLTAIPNELLALVIKRLPVRDICRLREQNRQLQTFVDANEDNLTVDVINHHRARISRDHTILTDLSGCDIVDVLARYYRHYGDPDHRSIHPRRSGTLSNAVASTLHLYWHKSRAIQDELQGPNACKNLYDMYTILQTNDDPEYFDNEVADVVLEEVSFWEPGSEADLVTKLISVTSENHEAAHTGLPRFVFSTRVKDPGYNPTHGGSRAELLPSMLGLPVLGFEDSLAYCTDNRKASKLVKEMGEGVSAKLRLAAIVEEIFVW